MIKPLTEYVDAIGRTVFTLHRSCKSTKSDHYKYWRVLVLDNNSHYIIITNVDGCGSIEITPIRKC